MIVIAAVLAAQMSAQFASQTANPLPAHFQDLLELTDRPISAYLPVDWTPASVNLNSAMTLYMNRFPGAYSCGEDDASVNVSSIACSADGGVAHMTGFAGTDAQWNEIVSCVGELFSPFDLLVTDQEPLEAGYVEAVVGGSPDQAGMGFGVGGVSPFACDLIPGAVTYIFADVYGDAVRDICETTAQELAHAFGLDHELLCEDPMTYLAGCGDKAFRDEYAPCGEFEPRECSCGETTQNSVQWMKTMFGDADGTRPAVPVDAAPPSVAFLMPTQDAIVPANTELTVVIEASDDVGLTVVELEWDFSGERMYCPSDGGAYSCSRNGTAYTWKIAVGQGLRNFRVRVRDVAGNEAVTEDRELWFSTDGNGPPNDLLPPTVFIGAPLQDTFLAADEPIEIIASMFDDTGLARAELDWRRRDSFRTYPCPYEDERVVCVTEGASYRWTFAARDGERAYKLRAVDVVGNMTESDLVVFTVEAGAPPAARDGNDTLDEAAALGCGDRVTVDGGDADWFKVSAASGTRVAASTATDGVRVLLTDGKAVLGEGDARASAVVSGDALFIGTRPGSSTLGGYTLEVTCEAPAQPTPKRPAPESCAGAGVPGLAVLLAVLGRRRRAPR